MAIVAVAIVLNFHLKSQPSALGKYQQSHWKQIALMRSREKMVTSTGNRFLAPSACMLTFWSIQLHWDAFGLQSSTSTCANRVEDADGVYSSCSSYCSYLRIAVINKCANSMKTPMLSCNS